MKIARRTLPGLLVAALLLVQAGLANAQALSCATPQKPMLDIELLLGRGKANEARWAQFLAREVTPRFPGWTDGLRDNRPVARSRDQGDRAREEPRAAHHRSGRQRAGQDRGGGRGLQETVPAEVGRDRHASRSARLSRSLSKIADHDVDRVRDQIGGEASPTVSVARIPPASASCSACFQRCPPEPAPCPLGAREHRLWDFLCSLFFRSLAS